MQYAPKYPLPHRLFLVCCAGLLLGACGKKNDMPPAAPHAPQVSVATLHTQQIDVTDDLSGRLSATEVAEVVPQVSGIVLKRLFVEGSAVRAGQPLYQLDPASYQAAYDTARGTLLAAVATSKAADITAKRYQELFKIKGVSQQDVDNYAAAAEEDKASIVSDRGSLETAGVNLRRTRILAPISGQIGESTVTAGALVTADQSTALATIQSLNDLYLDVTRSSAEALRLKKAIASGRVKPGTSVVTVLTEDHAAYAHPARLLFSDVTVNPTTGSITLRALVPNPEHQLLPGMYVQAKLDEGSQNVILVPQTLVTRGAGSDSTILVVDANNTVRSRPVTTSDAYGSDWIVSSGLQDGDRILTDSTQSVAAGTNVTPVEASATATAPATASGASPVTAQ